MVLGGKKMLIVEGISRQWSIPQSGRAKGRCRLQELLRNFLVSNEQLIIILRAKRLPAFGMEAINLIIC